MHSDDYCFFQNFTKCGQPAQVVEVGSCRERLDSLCFVADWEGKWTDETTGLPNALDTV